MHMISRLRALKRSLEWIDPVWHLCPDLNAWMWRAAVLSVFCWCRCFQKGWKRICTEIPRALRGALKHCRESSAGLIPGLREVVPACVWFTLLFGGLIVRLLSSICILFAAACSRHMSREFWCHVLSCTFCEWRLFEIPVMSHTVFANAFCRLGLMIWRLLGQWGRWRPILGPMLRRVERRARTAEIPCCCYEAHQHHGLLPSMWGRRGLTVWRWLHLGRRGPLTLRDEWCSAIGRALLPGPWSLGERELTGWTGIARTADLGQIQSTPSCEKRSPVRRNSLRMTLLPLATLAMRLLRQGPPHMRKIRRPMPALSMTRGMRKRSLASPPPGPRLIRWMTILVTSRSQRTRRSTLPCGRLKEALLFRPALPQPLWLETPLMKSLRYARQVVWTSQLCLRLPSFSRSPGYTHSPDATSSWPPTAWILGSAPRPTSRTASRSGPKSRVVFQWGPYFFC